MRRRVERRRSRRIGDRRARIHVGSGRPRTVQPLRLLRRPDGRLARAVRLAASPARIVGVATPALRPVSLSAESPPAARARTVAVRPRVDHRGCRRVQGCAASGQLRPLDRRGIRAGHRRGVPASVQLEGLGASPRRVIVDVDWRSRRARQSAARRRQHPPRPRRRVVGTEQPVPLPSSWRHGRHLARAGGAARSGRAGPAAVRPSSPVHRHRGPRGHVRRWTPHPVRSAADDAAARRARRGQRPGAHADAGGPRSHSSHRRTSSASGCTAGRRRTSPASAGCIFPRTTVRSTA